MLQEKPSDLKREHPSFQNKKFLIFALLDPDPDYESGSETPISRFSLPPAGDVCTLALQTVTLVLFLFHIVTMFVFSSSCSEHRVNSEHGEPTGPEEDCAACAQCRVQSQGTVVRVQGNFGTDPDPRIHTSD